MAEDARKKEWAATKASGKGLLICLAALCLAGAAAWFGLNTGLERLPTKVCDGAVERDVVIRTLPRTRTAEEGASRRREGRDLMFSCHIYTSADSVLSGMARIEDASMQQWLNHYGASTGSDAVRVSANGIEALAKLDSESGSSSVYVPCVPLGARVEDANESYAIITEAGVVGDSKVSGAALRQAVTDFAYQVTKHTYELAECQDPRTFPEDLPRYEDN
ncbi:hypothetical protein [Streptomyces sp. NPDC048252]|uniref:hypothetical protein n=1 Tax=Streptomyces sp. NPDC048252 TaxID=3154612 RepID=UPI003417E868